MPPPLQPEFFLLIGIDLFLATSLLTCLLDRHFPWQIPYLFQLAALAGFGQLFVSRTFIELFGEYMRFWYSFLYLSVSLASVVALNAYLGFIKKLVTYAKTLMLTVTFPAMSIAVFFLANYSEIANHPMVMVPQLPWETTFIGIVALDTFVVGLGTYFFFKPRWWYLGIGGGATIAGAIAYAALKPTWGEAPFMLSAIALAIACVLILIVSVYVLARIWTETWKERKRKKEVK